MCKDVVDQVSMALHHVPQLPHVADQPDAKSHCHRRVNILHWLRNLSRHPSAVNLNGIGIAKESVAGSIKGTEVSQAVSAATSNNVCRPAADARFKTVESESSRDERKH